MSKIKKSELLDIVREQGSAITNLLQRVTLLEKPQLKQLDQSVFDGLDEKWRFAAIDGNKRFPIVYEFEPYAFESGKYYTNRHGLYKDLTHLTGYDTSNWQNSLIERDIAKELTGSDLARAMLERGDILVACKFSDYSEYKAIEQPVVTLIKEFNGTCFRNTNGSFYRYVVPINLATGEPLTQAEAGL